MDRDLEKYGHIRVVVAPGDDENNEFEWRAPHEELPFPYMKDACCDGIAAALLEPLPQCGQLVRVRISVVGGSYHDIDTDDGSVSIAAARALRDALSHAILINA